MSFCSLMVSHVRLRGGSSMAFSHGGFCFTAQSVLDTKYPVARDDVSKIGTVLEHVLEVVIWTPLNFVSSSGLSTTSEHNFSLQT